MPTFNVHEAKTHFSRLLDLTSEGEEVVITRNNVPIARLVPARKAGLVLGGAQGDAAVNPAAVGDDAWWQPMTDEEADAFIDGRA